MKISLDDRVILEKDMNGYIDEITAKFPPGRQTGAIEASLEDMSLRLENQEVAVLLIFNNIQINVEPFEDRINYWFDLDMIYLK